MRFFMIFVAQTQVFDYFCKQICINHIKKIEANEEFGLG